MVVRLLSLDERVRFACWSFRHCRVLFMSSMSTLSRQIDSLVGSDGMGNVETDPRRNLTFYPSLRPARLSQDDETCTFSVASVSRGQPRLDRTRRTSSSLPSWHPTFLLLHARLALGSSATTTVCSPYSRVGHAGGPLCLVRSDPCHISCFRGRPALRTVPSRFREER